MILQDLSTLETIPGYAAILKAVIKAQIQVLVEQLHEQGGEETLILTASVQEGTLCHLGSNRGQGFLSGRDDIKSQFLAYCQQGNSSQDTRQKLYPLYYRNFDAVAASSVLTQPQGNPTQPQGNPIQPQGNPIQVQGNPIQVQGSSVQSQGGTAQPKDSTAHSQGSTLQAQGNNIYPLGSNVQPQGNDVHDSNRQLPSVSLDWAKTVAEQGVTVIKNSPKKLTILSDPIGGSVVGNSHAPGPVSLLQKRNSNTSSGILHSIVIESGNQASLSDNRGQSNAMVYRNNNGLTDSRLENSFSFVDNSLGTSEVSSVSAFVTSDEKIVMNETIKSSSVDVKDKNKKTLSSKIEEITERIKKDETQRVGADDSSLDHCMMEVTEHGGESQLRPAVKVMSHAADASPSKIKDVSRASHRKPKQPRFNIGVASDEEDNEVTKDSFDTGVTEDILSITDLTVSMDDADSTFTPVSLDDLGDGVILKENVTEIPIVEYSNGDVNKTEIEVPPSTKPSKGRKQNSKRLSHAIRVCGSNSEKKWFKCTMCPEKFSNQEMLNSHFETVVHMPKKCECDLCGRTFGQLRDMERHRRIHTGEKPFTCDICNRSFARKDNLRSHKLNHLRKQLKTQGYIK